MIVVDATAALAGLLNAGQARKALAVERVWAPEAIDVELANWRGVFGAPGLTPAQRDELIAAVKKAVDDPHWKKSVEEKLWTEVYLPGEGFGQYVAEDSKRLGAILALEAHAHAAIDGGGVMERTGGIDGEVVGRRVGHGVGSVTSGTEATG